MTRILITILFGLTCCSTDKKSLAYIADSDRDFMEFVSILPKVSLPFETNCEKCCDHPEIDYDNELIKKFSEPPDSVGTRIIGLIGKTDDKVIILLTHAADNFLPTIEVRDFRGKLLGQMSFLTDYCGGEPGYYGHQYFRINPDITLTSIDTSYYFTVDSLDYHTIDTTKVDIIRKNFLINNKGEVVENNAHLQ